MPRRGTAEGDACLLIARPSASSVQTPVTGTPVLAARPRAVANPIRMPTKDPGPRPTTRRPTCSQPPLAAAARSTSASRAVECRGLPSGAKPSVASCRTSPPRRAQTAVSAVAVSKPTTAFSWALSSASDLEDEGADAFTFDEPGDAVLAGDVRGHLVDVERALRGRLGFRADVFAGRELDADAVVDVALEALEEGTLFGPLRTLVRRLCVLGDAAGNVVLIGSSTGRRRRRACQQYDRQQHRAQRPHSPHSSVPPFAFRRSSMLHAPPPLNTAIRGRVR